MLAITQHAEKQEAFLLRRFAIWVEISALNDRSPTQRRTVVRHADSASRLFLLLRFSNSSHQLFPERTDLIQHRASVVVNNNRHAVVTGRR